MLDTEDNVIDKAQEDVEKINDALKCAFKRWGNASGATLKSLKNGHMDSRGSYLRVVNMKTNAVIFENGSVFTYLPNKNGDFKRVKLPEYLLDILENVTNESLETYRLQGVNSIRPGYGVRSDIRKLEAWVTRFWSSFELLYVNESPKNYYGIFRMTDPVAHALEKCGLLASS